MFLRIYIGLLAAISLALVSSYLIFKGVNQVRVSDYNKAIYSGTFKLIQQGLQRHQGERRDEWLAIVQRLSGLDLSLHRLSSERLNQQERASLESQRFVFTRLDQHARYRVRLLIDSAQYLESEIESVSEQQLRIAVLLVLNELGRGKISDLERAIQSIQPYFSFPFRLEELSETRLDNTQRKRVKNGAIAVVLSTDQNLNESHSIYALLDKQSTKVLIYGPISTFVDTPFGLLALLVLVSILIIGIAAYFMVRRLEIRLKSMSSLVAGFGPKDLQSRVVDTGADTVAQLAGNFNNMAERIARLIEDQKHMSQAISHELRTPIARMKFRLDILHTKIENLGEEDELTEKVEGLKRDLNELNTLIDEALFFQQIDSLDALVSTGTETLLLSGCCQEIVEKSLPMYANKQLEVHIDKDVKVQAHGVYLRRLLQNLIVNALRHCESRVSIGYEYRDAYHVITVDDDGDGIDEALRESLFQPFQRAETSRNKQLGGYGLGLAIVKRVAELHQGDVEILTSDLGGARFLFKWPDSQTLNA